MTGKRSRASAAGSNNGGASMRGSSTSSPLSTSTNRDSGAPPSQQPPPSVPSQGQGQGPYVPRKTLDLLPLTFRRPNPPGTPRIKREDEIKLFQICLSRKEIYRVFGESVPFWQQISEAFQRELDRMYSYTACRRRVENAVRIRKLEQEGREKGKYFNDEECNRPLDEWIEFVDREEEARKAEERQKQERAREARRVVLETEMGAARQRREAAKGEKLQQEQQEQQEQRQGPSEADGKEDEDDDVESVEYIPVDADRDTMEQIRRKRARYMDPPFQDPLLSRQIGDLAAVVDQTVSQTKAMERRMEDRLNKFQQSMLQYIDAKFQDFMDRLERE